MAVNSRQFSGHTRGMESQWPMPVIRYAYYAVIGTIVFADVLIEMGMIAENFSPVKMVLVGFMMVAFLQPGVWFRRPPEALWWFAAYILVFFVLGMLLESEFESEVIRESFRLVQFVGFFWISFNLMRYQRVVRGTLLTIALSCTSLAVLQVLGITVRVSGARVAAGEGNPNMIAFVLALGFLALMGLSYSWKGMSRKIRWVAWSGFGVLVLAIVASGSRGGIVALSVGLLVFLLQGKSFQSKLKVGLIVLLGMGALIGVSYQVEAVRSRWEATLVEGSLAKRELIWPAAWSMVQERPLTGWGPINYTYELGSRLSRGHKNRPGGQRPRDPHNLILELLTRTGLLGAIPFFTALWLCLRAAWRARDGIQGVLPMAMLLCLLIKTMTGPMVTRYVFWMVLAYALASASYVERPRSPKARMRRYQLVKRPSTMHPLSP